MRKLILMIALPLLALPGLAQSRANCLRVMPVDELTRTSILIARVKVQKIEKANYRGSFSQVAFLKPLDVLEGDFTLKQFNVLSRSNVRCAEDNYINEQEMLVFLEPEDSLFHTVNYQYGQFLIANEIVKGWRDANNKPIDKPYADVRQEIIGYVNAARTTRPEAPPPSTTPPKPVKPPINQ